MIFKRLFGSPAAPTTSSLTAAPRQRFVARYTPPVHDEHELGYPEGEFAEAWERFKAARQMLEPFRTKFDKEFQEAEWKGHFNFNSDIKVRVRGETYTIYHSESELFDWLLHKSSCSKRDRSNHANGWEFKYTGRMKEFRGEMAGYLLENSPSLRKILAEQQGLWWEYLQSQSHGWLSGPEKTVYEQPEYLSEELYDHLWRTNAMVFELLVPNFYLHLEATAKRFGIGVQRERGSERYVPDAHDRMRQFIQEIVDEINEHRDECRHFDENVCILCDLQVKPNLAGNLRFNFPNEVCAWCLKILDYHALPVLSAGKTRDEVANQSIEGFRLAVKTFKFPYWRSPSPSTKMLVGLGLRTKTPLRIREFAAVIAGMPRELTGFDSPLHFMKAAGFESLANNPKSRGKKSISTCNHICLSLGERDICEYLAASGFEHTREPSYGPLTGAIGITEFGGMRGDFLVGKTVIEFAGLAGNAEYDAKMELKQKLCRDYGIDLIVVLPNDLSRLEALLSKERFAS
jgi:hypothetical protein